MNLTQFLIRGTPFYPHWLEFRNLQSADDKLVRYYTGNVLEVGCGNGERKARILGLRGKFIRNYTATDHTSWDDIFEDFNHRSTKLGFITRYLFGKTKSASSIDDTCDALNIKYKKSSFDTYCAFEVLEHISDPEKFFSEAARVLKTGGHMIISVPFLYREHSEGTGYDYLRYTKSGLIQFGKRHGLRHVKTVTDSYFGTTIAAATNQYLIRKIMEKKWITKIILCPFAPLVFFTMNVFGLLIDSIDRDERYATRFHSVFRKI